ncbi:MULTISPECIES: hypothetical protein [Xanthomonas]|uniref:Uncharacterized protein n=1 Tax=Xanthomonas citri pv. phaseoli var. fuscans TaxID=473423 RepID=A0AB33F9Y3_XANCI|nr:MULTISPECIES: hypothetical protein [Xanthomonas]ATS40454.1 hypothetical protein XcfCFBP6988P_21905 [Xanthomonas citri pv. phaseoli var. fuscans]ATS44630.1 hypothetical protein XcfCFBP6989P_21370 [Xanthomonas citri pv. phaseoli var. fuscans]ATS85160.1 hypothetical protein XcfCFBP6991P_15465 [Xanthomonas citri pv. phaseoli var. fuscans]QWN22074.1 hypothetical protein DGM98_19850 [Xanthomonas citri]UZA99186.1 hypothetical protein OM946_19040 [Xanthomonas citri pv. fuscans]
MTTNRSLRCLTATQLRGVARPQLERWLASTRTAEGALDTLIGMGCTAPQYANDRAICEHNRKLLTRQLGRVAA